MTQEIIQGIVMFLLGSVLTYFSTRWSKALKEFDRMGIAVQALLRDRMLQMYSYYKESGKPVPMRERESFNCMYDAYTDNHGNSFMPQVKDEFMELPHENH